MLPYKFSQYRTGDVFGVVWSNPGGGLCEWPVLSESVFITCSCMDDLSFCSADDGIDAENSMPENELCDRLEM